MIIVDLYIDGTRVDFYEDQSITIRDRIKDSKDPGTLYTSFTQQFTLPASKTNNKVFKAYHNPNVLEGFDARQKITALIKLNGADFRKGYIKLNGVDLKDNKAKQYRVQFFGELTSLKDLFGEDLLQNLAYTALHTNTLNKYNHEYSLANVKAGMEDSLVYSGGSMSSGSDGEIIYPFISHTRQFEYTVANGLHVFNDSSSPLNYVDLKPALRVSAIFDLIASKYGITWGGDFKDSDIFKDLFLWLHRNKGYMVSDVSGNTDLNWTEYMDNLDYDSGDGDFRPLTTFHRGRRLYQRYSIEFEVAPVGSEPYDFFIKTHKNDAQVSATGVTGTQSITLELNSLNYPLNNFGQYETIPWNPLFIVHTGDSGVSTFTPTITVTKTYRIGFTSAEVVETSVFDANGAVTTISDVIISEQIPKMKIIDFVRGIFKMFNLVAYDKQLALSDDYEIIFEPLDDFYGNGKAIDITKYVDISEGTVERVSPYNTMKFKYEDPSTYLITRANELSNFEFGNASLSLTEEDFLFDGGKYDISVGFEKMMYERLADDTGANTDIIYGWYVDDQEEQPEAAIGAPLVFYRHNRSASSENIDWDGGSTSSTYNAASNVNSDQTQTLHFDAETDEFEQGDANTESLFANYYATYIEGIFDASTRRRKVTAYLPPRIIYNYSLADKILIQGVEYQIDSININLKNGKTQLDLLKMSAIVEKFPALRYVQKGYVDAEYVL